MSDNDFSDEENENEDNNFDDEYSGIKNVALILIDICPEMFDESKLIKKCLAAVYTQMDKMLLRGYRRNISVCLLRDEDVILTGLNDNLLDSTKHILHLLQQNTDDLKQTYERKSPPSLRYTFSECLKQIKNLGKINPHIVLMTNDDDPHKGDVKENLSAIDVALFLKESNVKLVVLPMKENFKYDLFYGELLKAANDVPLDFMHSEDHVYNTVDDLNDILECIIKNKVTIRRYYFRLFSKEGQQLSFWTQIRYLVKSSNIYANCNISRETKNTVKQQYEDQQNIDVDKLLVKIPTEMDIKIEKNDFLKMREQLPIGFQLLYFTKDKRSSIHYVYRRGMVLQNDETDSDKEFPKKKQLFDDLWHYCRRHKKYMICAYIGPGLRQVPHIMEFSAEVFQNKPCFVGQTFVDCEEIGDYPCSDETETDDSSLKAKNTAIANSKQLEYMCDMIDKLTVKNFTPSYFSCYEYETKAALVKAQLLDTDVQELEDSFPTNEKVKERLGDTYDQLRSIFSVIEEPKAKRSRKK